MSKVSCGIADHGGAVQVHTTAIEDGYELGALVDKQCQGTTADMHDMNVLGRVQRLRRNFHFLSILGFATTLICTWEIILTMLAVGMTDGGTAGIFLGYIVIIVGFLLVYAGLAEVASMAPMAGGWLSFTGWQAAIVFVAFLVGTIIQGLIVLNDSSYVFERWHGTMLIIAISAFSTSFNTVFAPKLHLVEGVVLVVHILGLLAIIIPLWILAPKNNAHAVFVEFTNIDGWQTTGAAVMVGLITTFMSMLGFDCQVHMSEEVKDASSSTPRVLLYSVCLNAVLGLIIVVTICFTLGDVDSILNTPTRQPFIPMFYNATSSYAGTNIMTAIVIVTLTASAIAEATTASRQLWSFARDKGVPFSQYLSRHSSLINSGSTAALQAILSLAGASLTTSYIIVIGCILLKRIRGQPLPSRRWSLGRWGVPINVASLCSLIPIYIFQFFPVTTPVTPASMSWSSMMYGAMIVFATVYYFLYGKKQYIPPVALVKRDIF